MLRRATHDDVQALADLAGALVSESPEWRGMNFSAAKATQMLHFLVDSPRGFVMLAEQGGAVVGAMVAAASEHWACEALVAFELGLYVLPGSRGASIGLELMRAYRRWVSDVGALKGTAGVSTGVQTERTAALYEAAGFRRLGALFDTGGV